MNSIPKLLSKTRLMKGYRCLKCIYLAVHQPELEAPITPDTQALFDQGNRIGAKAREHYPGGVLVDNKPWDFSGSLARTRELLAQQAPIIYEAAFAYQGCYARTDILQYAPETKRWRIFEVKSATKIHPEYYDDVGLQAWVLAKSGLPIEQINIVHLNPECRYPELSKLFKEVDVTAEIRARYLSIQPKLREIFQTLQQPQVPDIDLGPYCLEPRECGFKQHCWQQKNIPELSIFNLPRINERAWEFYREGMIRLDDSRLFDLNEMQERMVACFKSKERYINQEAIQAALAEWQYPFTFLDFETIAPAIPRYEGCHPFNQVPFQFSAHHWPTPAQELTHTEFLHVSTDDPRPALVPALLKACGESGSIVAYHALFEKARIKELADYSPEHRDALLRLLDRFVDPLPLIRETIYDNAFAGSFSLKNVAPGLLGKAHSYEGMLVADGGAAQRAFEEMISPATAKDRKMILKQALLDYCKKDTFVMVELVRWLLTQTG